MSHSLYIKHVLSSVKVQASLNIKFHFGEGGSCSAGWWLGQQEQQWFNLTGCMVGRTVNYGAQGA